MYTLRDRKNLTPLSEPFDDIEKAIDQATWLGNCHLCHKNGIIIMTIDYDGTIIGEINVV